MSKYFLFDKTDNSLAIIFAMFPFQDWTIRVREGNMRDPWHKRIETAVIMRLTGCKRN
jgi:hypothetical protein